VAPSPAQGRNHGATRSTSSIRINGYDSLSLPAFTLEQRTQPSFSCPLWTQQVMKSMLPIFVCLLSWVWLRQSISAPGVAKPATDCHRHIPGCILPVRLAPPRGRRRWLRKPVTV
jgi:hypothetical protein